MVSSLNHGREPRPMRRYELKPLSPEELRSVQQILAEQIEKQRWYVVVVLRELIAEIAVPIN